jgi:hypothetical protein
MDDSSKILNELYDKYKDNVYAYSRLQNYINNIPNWIINDLSIHEKRVNRTNELTIEYDFFCKIFLSKHKYYYLSTNNCFYEYDDKTYKIIKEDDIHYNLLSTITEEGKLIQWKHKTKSHIIKLIKERNLFQSIPETYTIQTVLGFLQTTIFESKSVAKYFLTIIGDNLLKKNNNYIYLVSQNTKKILQLIDEICCTSIGSSNIQNFITKHHENHDQPNYRLIKTRTMTASYHLVKDLLNKIGIDLLCVAAHYSHRYKNAENYLQINNKENCLFKTHALFLSNNTKEQIINDFIQQCLVTTEDNSSIISWKNMHYIWKLYLSNLDIPNMIYSNHLKDFLKTKLNYNIENDVFNNVTSKYLPQISIFLQFWEKYISISQESFNEYEIDELTILFKSIYPNTNMSEEDMIKIIKHFFHPHVEILNNKYIINIQCSLWNKVNNIDCFLNYYKNNLLNTEVDMISFDEFYNHYQSFSNANMYVNKTISMIVSKDYFEKYIQYTLQNYIEFDKFIGNNWYTD